MRRKDLFEFKQFTITQKRAAMKVGTDSDLLGALALGGNRILDIGTGTGVIALMMAQRFPEASIAAIDVDEGAFADASENFARSPFHDRLSLQCVSLQEYLQVSPEGVFDCIVCNPPYFEKSLECPDDRRTWARHTSSLPFPVLANGAARLLQSNGIFSVCIPLEVLELFIGECQKAGLSLVAQHNIRTIPSKPAKRFVLCFRKGLAEQATYYEHNMLNEERERSEWYRDLMHDFLII